jgi:hypothetical protein
MTLQSHDVVINYAKAKNLPLGSALAVCQRCGDDETDSAPPPRDIAPPLPSNHHYFEENVCLEMPMVFVDGCMNGTKAKQVSPPPTLTTNTQFTELPPPGALTKIQWMVLPGLTDCA